MKISARTVNINDVKQMRYLDYRLNNSSKLMKKYPRNQYPRLVDYLFDLKFAGHLDSSRIQSEKQALYRLLWREGLFHSCQA